MSFSHWCHSKAFTFPSCWAEVCPKKHGQKQHFNAQNLWKLEYWHILQINPSFDLPKIIRIIQEYTRKSSEDRYSTNMNKQYQTIWNKIKCNKRSYSTCKNPQMEIPLPPELRTDDPHPLCSCPTTGSWHDAWRFIRKLFTFAGRRVGC